MAEIKELEEFYVVDPHPLREWKEYEIDELFQWGGTRGAKFARAKRILQQLVSENAWPESNFLSSEEKLKHDEISQRFHQIRDTDGTCFVSNSHGPHRWRNFEVLASQAINSWVVKIRKHSHKVRCGSKAVRESNIRNHKGVKSEEDGGTSEGSVSSGEPATQKSSTQRTAHPHYVRKRRRLVTYPDPISPGVSARARPTDSIGLKSTPAAPMTILSLQLIHFLVVDDTKPAPSPRCWLRTTECLSLTGSSKLLSDLRTEDLSFDVFKGLCAIKLGFNSEKHTLFYSVPIDQENTEIPILAATEEAWRYGISSQSWKTVVEFRFHEIPTVQQAVNQVDEPTLMPRLHPSSSRSERSLDWETP